MLSPGPKFLRLRRRTALIWALATAALLAWLPVRATTLFVTSIAGQSVQVIINGSVVRTLRPGEGSPEGVRLAGIERGIASFEIDNQSIRLGIGQSTASQVTLRMSPDGQFRVTAYVNGVALRAVIDTGASNVAFASGTAAQLGIDYRRGRPGIANTANGSVPTYFVNLSRVQIGDITVANVAGNVSEGATISRDMELLIGNSFLSQVHMQRSGDTMILTRGNGF